MSRKANKTAIGAFVVGAAALVIAAILVFGSGAFLKKSDKYILFFDGSVKGLAVGAPVVFRGVNIGNVDNISLLYSQKTKSTLIAVIADLELSLVKGEPEKLDYPNYQVLIDRGLRARLEVQSFITGQLMISFDFYPDKPVILQGIFKKYPELPTLPISPDIFAIMEELPIKEISGNLKRITAGVDKLMNSEELQDSLYELRNSLQEITRTARSIRVFVEYLEQHPEAIFKGKQSLPGERYEAN